MVRSTMCWSTRSRQIEKCPRPPASTRLTSSSPTSLSARGSTLGSSGELCFYMVECNGDHFRKWNCSGQWCDPAQEVGFFQVQCLVNIYCNILFRYNFFLVSHKLWLSLWTKAPSTPPPTNSPTSTTTGLALSGCLLLGSMRTSLPSLWVFLFPAYNLNIAWYWTWWIWWMLLHVSEDLHKFFFNLTDTFMVTRSP